MKLSTTSSLLAAVFTFFSVVSAFNANSNQNIALYWGQASAGFQGSLASYCENNDADIIVLSFLIGYTDPITLNFASACETVGPDGVLKCDQIGADIKTCQAKGKKVLLSLGGAAGSYGFQSDQQGEAFATTLWNYFGEGTTTNRPLGDAVVDGFDFDIENNNQVGYVKLANKLRQYFAKGSKPYYLSAAPQCPYPDASVGDVLANSYIDFAFVQFYNNYCSVEGQFNWKTWTDYARNVSPNKNIKIFLGLPASVGAAGSGYININTIQKTLGSIGSDPSFGGVMLWDASQSQANQVNGSSFAGAIRKLLNALGGGGFPTQPSTAASISSQSSKTSTIDTLFSTTNPITNTQTSTFKTFVASSSLTEQLTTNLGSPAATSVAEVGSPIGLSITLSNLNKGVTQTTLSTVTVSASKTSKPSDVPQSGCSLLTGEAKVSCLNAQYQSGQFSGSGVSCENNETACSKDGQFAMCVNGAWIIMGCASGTRCYSFIENTNVVIGCNYASES